MYSAIAANKRNTVIIMIVFVSLVALLGWLVSLYYGQPLLTPWVIGGAGLYALFQYFAAAKLATVMTGAKQIQKHDNPRLWRIVENLSITNGMPMPKVYMMNDSAPNAFATGRDPHHAIVAATTGLLDIMNDQELEAVMAHEMGHVQNYDIRVSMIAFGLVSAIGIISDIILRMMWFGGNDRREVPPQFYIIGIIAAVIAPIVASLIQMAISRQREYLADATGVMITRYPEGLASALEKLKQHGKPLRTQSSSTAHLFFSNPLKSGFISKMFSTHPPLDDRIARLRNLEGKI